MAAGDSAVRLVSTFPATFPATFPTAFPTASAPAGVRPWRPGSPSHPIRVPARRPAGHRGYLLLESLLALAMLGIGLLPLAWLGPAALQWWREPLLVGQALRLAAEAAELAGLAGLAGPDATPDPARLPALAQVNGLPPPRWCAAAPANGAQPACPAGQRVVVVGPLPPTHGIRTETGSADIGTTLRAIVLRLRP